MRTITIFLISGKAGHGKDEFFHTAVDYLSSDKYPTRFAYGDCVKDVALYMGWDGMKDVKGRGLLQTIGDGARRYDPDIWIKKTLTKMEQHFIQNQWGGALFITDCRYPNEIDEPRKWAGFLSKLVKKEIKVVSVRVTRQLDFDSGLTAEQKQNSSETALDDYTKFDYMIANIGTLEEYREKIIQVLDKEINI